tara:strand:+ start:1845 stop:2885 length:1041 start_codon:yes stop_codon:yes gene_type:complete
MAIVHSQGFDLVSDAADMAKAGWAYAEGLGIAATANKWGGPCWDLGVSTNSVIQHVVTTYATDHYKSVSFWRYYSAMPASAASCVVMLGDNPPSGSPIGSSSHFSIYTQPGQTGDIQVNRASAGQVAIIPSVIKVGVWQHWEARVFHGTSTGTIEIWVDGIKIADFTGLDTIDSNNSGNWTFAGAPNNANCYIDDIVMAHNNVGPEPQRGIHRIQTLYPNGDSANTAWTGTFADVDDPQGGSDEDTTFAATAVLNAKQDYTLTDLVDSPATIHGVNVYMESRKTDAGLAAVTPYINSNATEAAGVEVGSAEAYGVTHDVFVLNPDGAVAWNTAAVDALIVGHELTS